ncbi:MAG: pyridoxal phosphate-dependent aminotransferase [Natrialbaceae archaeon]|nr:pyridoxal phosphate-dependent aminotransferase [Natrialbaceae archaeon]
MDYDTPLFYHVMEYADSAPGPVIDMVSGNPDWGPPDGIRSGFRTYADGEPAAFQYPPSEGLAALREEIADRRGVGVDQVIVTNGTGEANYLALAAALERSAGSEVLLTDPVYPYYPGKVSLLGGQSRFVPTTDSGQLEPERIRAAAGDETAAIVVNTPNNPTGAVYPGETMTALVDIAEAHDTLLISDEVYDHYDLTGTFSSALSVDSQHRVVTNGFSKSMAITGARVGYVILPKCLYDGARRRHMLINVAGSRPAQTAVLTALRETGPDYYETNRQRLRERIETFTDALESMGASYTRPDGAFYVMARFGGIPGTLENVKTLIDEAGVAGMPGETFGRSRSDWIRFAMVTPRVQEAAERLEDYVS